MDERASGSGRAGSTPGTWAALVVLLVGAVVLRVSAAGFGHSFLSFQPDEDANALRALSVGAGTLNPHYFYYPELFWFLLAGVYRIAFFVGRQLGLLHEWADLVRLHQDGPVLLYIGRGLNVALGTATVVCVYYLGRRLFSPAHGLLAAAFLAGAFLHVRDSGLGTVDVPLTLFVVLALLGAARLLETGRARDYVLAAVAAGLATATKYDGAAVFAAVVAAHALRTAREGGHLRRILTAPVIVGSGLGTALVFLAVNPFLLLDWREAWGDPTTWGSLRWEWRYVHSVEYDRVGPASWYHLTVSLRYGMGLALLALAVIGILQTLRRRDARGLVLLSFAVPFFAAVSGLSAVFVRYMTPVVPVLCLFATLPLLSLTRRIAWPKARALATATLGLAALLEPLDASAAYGRLAHHPDTRIEVQRFIETALPRGSDVATYGPSVTWRSTIPRWTPIMYAKHPKQTWADVLAALKSDDVDYFLLHHSALGVFSPDFPDLERTLRESATLVREFDPDKPGAHPSPVYDHNDAYYFPVGRFHGIVRPGPLIRLYRLR